MPEKEYWVMRAERGKYTKVFVESGFVAIGWEKINDTTGRSIEEVRCEYVENYGGSPFLVALNVGQIWRFANEMNEGDVVLTPNHERASWHLGEIVGPYEYEKDREHHCPYPHRRRVRWFREVEREIIPEPLKSSLGSWLTIFKVSRYANTIDGLIREEPPPPGQPVWGSEMRKAVLQRFLTMSPTQFEGFITHILSILGFSASTTRPVSDGGVDVEGLATTGLVKVPLKVQVKRHKGNIGSEVVNQLRGTLANDEYGAVVTASGFTKSARAAAEKKGLKTVFLVDGEGLVDLVLENYEKLDLEYKNLLTLERVFVARKVT